MSFTSEDLHQSDLEAECHDASKFQMHLFPELTLSLHLDWFI
jgi:hypothetical protein